MKFITFTHEEKRKIPQQESWPETVHVFDQESIWAINAAIASGRPLLLRGEPGTGKSQLARAAAHALNCAFIYEVINAKSEFTDLLYNFDAVARLGEAQLLGNIKCDCSVEENLKPEKFLTPGTLWWGYNWKTAEEQYKKSNKSLRRPAEDQKQLLENGSVILIDEIDKADSDMPNGLLETLGNGAFTVPYINETVTSQKDNKPLVIITTNEEKELPAAFIRRCLVYNMSIPKNDDELIKWLCERGKIHFNGFLYDDVGIEAAKLLIDDRKTAEKHSLPKPGQAEYLDLLRAVLGLNKDDKSKQLQTLKDISKFVFKKHPEK